MTHSRQKKVKPASPHLNSEILFEEFKKLTTKPQYTQGERGDILEQTEIINSVRIEETNADRLKLAEKVLEASLKCLEYENNLHFVTKAKKEQDKKEAEKVETPPQTGAGGYH